MTKQQTEKNSATSEKTPEPTRPTPKPGELKILFQNYESANAAVDKASKAYDKAMSDRSRVVEQFAGFGQAFTAPNGDRLTVTKRTNKETGAVAYYFKGPGKAEALKID